MQIARTGYLAAYSSIPRRDVQSLVRKRDILPPRILSTTRPSPRPRDAWGTVVRRIASRRRASSRELQAHECSAI
jgi:hypothetical protein